MYVNRTWPYQVSFKCSTNVNYTVCILLYFKPLSNTPTPNLLSFFTREVVLGEHKVGEDPDCWQKDCWPDCCQKKVQRFGVESVINHPNWNAAGNGYRKGYDIALVRLDGNATLYSVSSHAHTHTIIRYSLIR